MSTAAFVKRQSLVVFFALAYALTWPVIPMVSVSPLLGFPALFGPALAAIIVSAVTDGKPGLRDLLVRWRVGARWYAVVLGLPVALALTAAGLHLLLGAQTSVDFGGLSVLNFVVFVLIVGEELGWRGFALPRLPAERSALAASLIVARCGARGTCLRSSWRELPSTAALLRVLAPDRGLLGRHRLGVRPRAGSVLVASLMHGAINLSQGFFLGGVDPTREWPPCTGWQRSSWRSSSVRACRASIAQNQSAPRCNAKHLAVDLRSR